MDSPESDEDLLTRIQAGQHDRFTELVRRYESELYGYLRRYTGHDDLAADVFQSTFVAVFTKIHHYQPGRAARPWLYTVATHQAIDALRQRKRRPEARSLTSWGATSSDDFPGLSEALPGSAPDPADAAEQAEFRERMQATVDQLPEFLKQVVLLAYFQGLRYQEIAETLNIPLGTVKSRLNAALTRLGDAWQAQTPPDPDS